MPIKGGYWGKILRVDLSKEKIKVETFDDSFARKYLGGVCLAARLIYDWVVPNTNPLGPANLLVFATGPFQATTIGGAGRWVACARSPLTGYWGESNAGAHAGPRLKKAGFDAIAISGRASKPVFLWIHDGEAELKSAMDYWGSDTFETTDAILKDLGENDKTTSIVAIGQAGENLVRYACIAVDKHGYHGRTGMGAVMGSKNLKAIAIKGTLTPPVADPDKLQETWNEILDKVMEAPFTKENREHGMPAAMVPREENGLLPMKNWAQDRWPEGAKKLGTPRYTEELRIEPWACEYCIMGCHRKITNPEYPREGPGPEYETLAMLGSDLLIDDLKVQVMANDLCNRYGIDTIELGGILAWAFESYEKGILTKEDTDGVELKWGSGEALLTMIEKVAKRDGIGNLFAEGIRACVAKYPQTKPWAVEAMGAVVAAHDPRAFFGEVITTIASPRGSCHIHGFAEAIELGVTIPELGWGEAMDRFEYINKGRIGAVYQDIQQFWNSLVWCFFYWFSNVTLTDLVNLVNVTTGWDVTPEEARIIGERAVNIQHSFNLKMGLDPEKEFVLPERLETPHKEGGAAKMTPPWRYILREYYTEREWVNGIPSKDKLLKLGLDDIAKDLYG